MMQMHMDIKMNTFCLYISSVFEAQRAEPIFVKHQQSRPSSAVAFYFSASENTKTYFLSLFDQ